ncbi:G8 domain-containing protein [Rippkaea orientalis]|nr:G8 domain-containing protein [Rippkaea orientalis]
MTPSSDVSHDSFLSIVPDENVTHAAINNGSWFDVNTWQNGSIPSDNANVLISEGVEVLYDQESDARLKTVRIDGTLSFAQDQNTKMVVDFIGVTDTGTLAIGTETNPIQDSQQAQIIFAPVDPNNGAIDLEWDPNQFSRGLIADHGASVSIVGSEKTSYVTLAGDQLAGSTQLVFSEPVPSDWKVGDQIVLTGTQWNNKGSHEDNSKSQDEVLKIESINGNTITFKHNDINGNALRFDHTAPEGFDLDIYVANLTRNVSLATEGGDEAPISERGHTMFMDHDTVIENAGFYDLGRTNKDIVLNNPQFDSDGHLIPGTGTNAQGRYPIHIHEVFQHDPNDPGTAEINGNAIWGSPGWGVTIHSSRATVEDNVSFDVLGAHYVNEHGDEQTIFRDNIAIKASGSVTDPDANLVHPSDIRGQLNDFGSSGIGFWVATSYSAYEGFENNIVTGTADAGIIIYGKNDLNSGPIVSVDSLPDELKSLAGPRTEIHAYKIPVQHFTGNTVYNADAGLEVRGVTRDDNGFDANAIQHNVPNVYDNLTIWGVRTSGIEVAYSGRTTIKDSLVLGDIDNPIPRTGVANASGVGLAVAKDGRYTVYENVHVEGFTIGAFITQTGGQGYDNEAPIGGGQLIGGVFKNNIYNLHAASGRVNNAASSKQVDHLLYTPPLTPYYQMDGTTIFEIPDSNLAPVAQFFTPSESDPFYTSPTNGLSVAFDASPSYDPDYIPAYTYTEQGSYTAGDNTIASFAWDFNGDGQFDDYGRYVTYAFDQPGLHTVTLTVFDIQGASNTISHEINVTPVANNQIRNGDFSQPLYLDSYGQLYWNEIFKSPSNVEPGGKEGWFTGGTSMWNWDANTGRVYADNSGRPGLSQIIYDNHATQGLQTVSFDAINLGSDNTLRLEVLGINGQFVLSNNKDLSITTTNYNIPLEVNTILDTGNIAATNFDWTNFKWENLDFGQNGYEFVVLRFSTGGVSSTESQAIDNVFIGNSSNFSGTQNTPPLAVNDVAKTVKNQSVMINVTANDSDADGDFLFIKSVSQATNGTVVNNGDGTVTYTPYTQFVGNDSFEYTIVDEKGATSKATVSLTVDSPPTSSFLSFNNFNITSYGKNQDIQGTATIKDNGNTFNLVGNTWKKINLPYTVTANTVLEFSFQSNQKGEIHTIGFDNDNQESSNFNFQLYGTQSWGIQDFKNYQNSTGGWQNYRIEVGKFFTGQMSYLTFANDHDVTNPNAQSGFSNIKIYEATANSTNPVPSSSTTTTTGTTSQTTTIAGTSADDLINGTSGNDILTGNSGNDTLIGNAGDDVLTGGTGNDLLSGGSGGDTFNYQLGDGSDRIQDFQSGDTINLTGINASSVQFIGQGSDTFVTTGNNQGILLEGILPNALSLAILPDVLQITI